MKPANTTFILDSDHLSFIETMAKEIHACKVRSRGRSYEQVYAATKAGVILEFALEVQGARKNPLPFDVVNRESYSWDVEWNGLKTEVKRKAFLNDDRTKYYSWDKPEYVKTFLRNLDIAQQLIVGDYKQIGENTYNVEWMLMTKAGEGFKKYIKKSLYNEGQMYYNHHIDPNCTYLR